MRRATDPSFVVDRLEPRTLFAVTAGFTQTTFIDELDRPTAMAFAPDGRLFVAEQGGTLRVVKSGALLDAPFVSLAVNDVGERGLLGVTFDPTFADNGFVYVYYTTPAGGTHNRVSRFVADGDRAAADSETVLLDLPTLGASNHNGGAVHFGPDGKLYVGVGDNNDRGLSQSLETPLGKLLRMNPDGSVPNDNPFVGRTTGVNRLIWATGLRNPYTFAFDPTDGRLHINDVGNQLFEEINVGAAGANYGWSLIEGPRTTQTPPAEYVDPLFAYDRFGGPVSGSSIAGGAFYRAAAGAANAFPAAFNGDYLFADFGSGFVKSLDAGTGAVDDFASGLGNTVDVRVGADGRVYALDYGGKVFAFAPTGTNVPVEPPSEPPPDPAAALVASLPDPPPADVVQGERGRVKVVVANARGETVAGRVTVRLLASTDDTADAGDVVLGGAERRVRLKAGRERAFGFRFRYPDTLAGAVRLVAQVVPGAGIAEADPAEHAVASTPVTVSPPTVDLVPTFRDPPSEGLRLGRRNSVVVELANAGNVTFRGRVNVLLRASADNLPDAGDVVLFDADPKVKVAAGQTRGIRLRFRLPADVAANNYFLVFDLDRGGLIAEGSDANNQVVTAAVVAAM